MINVFGYVLEVLAVLMFIGAFREARRREFFEKQGVLTVKGKRDVVIIKSSGSSYPCFLGSRIPFTWIMDGWCISLERRMGVKHWEITADNLSNLAS